MVPVSQPLGVADAAEGGVLGGATEGGGVGVGKGFQLGFALVGEGIVYCGGLVVGAYKLADVAAEGIAGEVYVGRQGFGTVLDGVVGGTPVGIEQGDLGMLECLNA